MTKDEERKQAKAYFMLEKRSQFESLLTTYFLNQGYVLLGRHAEEAEDPIILPIRPWINEFYKAQRFVNDGGSLSVKRKDSMLQCIYQMEELIQKMDKTNSVQVDFDSYMSSSSSGLFSFTFAVLAAILGIWWPVAYLISALLVFVGVQSQRVAKKKKQALQSKAIRVISGL